MKSENTEIELGSPELSTRSTMVSEQHGPEDLGNTSQSEVTELPHPSKNGRKKKTECCGSVILRVIRRLKDIWRECIGCGLREETKI